MMISNLLVNSLMYVVLEIDKWLKINVVNKLI